LLVNFLVHDPLDLAGPDLTDGDEVLTTLWGPLVQTHLTESPFLIETLTLDDWKLQLTVFVVEAPVGAARAPKTATVAMKIEMRRILFGFLPQVLFQLLSKTLQVTSQDLAKDRRVCDLVRRFTRSG